MSEQSINAESYKDFLSACALVRSFGYEIAVIGQTDALRTEVERLREALEWISRGALWPNKVASAALEGKP